MRKNVGSFLAFNELWFSKNQRLLLWLLNAPIIKVWFRWVLRIKKIDCSLATTITEIFPNRFSWGDRLFFDQINHEWHIERTTDFRAHPKFGKRLYHAFKPLWWLIHFWDWAIADRYIPTWSYGFSTLTAYPDPHPESTTVDGMVEAIGTVTPTWAALRAGTGGLNVSADNNSIETIARITADGAGGFYRLYRSVYLFDTSSISGGSVSAATFSIYGQSKSDGLSITPGINVVSSNPASNTALVGADFTTLGNTAYSTAISYSSYSTTGYNNFVLNASGISAISTTGITKLGIKESVYDLGDTTPTSTSDFTSDFIAYLADNAGTSIDPKLVVTYTTSTAYTKTLSETVSHTATIAKQPKKILSETVTSTASFIKNANKIFSETISHTDSVVRTAKKLLSETVSHTDYLIKRTARSFVEAITHTDTFTTLKIQFKTFSDIITHSDSLDKSTNKVLSETTTLTDTINRFWQRTLSETANLTDSVLRLAARTLSEVATFSDSLIRVPGKIMSEAISLTDSIVKSAYKIISETITLTDTFSTGLSFGRVLTETISLTDSLSRLIGKVFSETISFFSFISNWFRVNRSSDATYNSVSRSTDATYNSVSRSSDSGWTGVNREP